MRMSNDVTWLTFFVLSVFVGIEVISKVSSTLHTPLMSGANAIHGVILLGAVLVAGRGRQRLRARRSRWSPIVLAAVNMVGGFVVTDRMLQMFTRKPSRPKKGVGAPDGDPRPGSSWSSCSARSASSSRSRASPGPRTARVGNLIGAGAAVVACALPFFYADLDHVVLILVAIVDRHRRSASSARSGCR